MSEIKIRPWTAQWNAWLKFHRGTRGADLMLKCVADAATARALWLRDRLAQVLASDVAAEDVAIEERDGRTAVVVRGAVAFEDLFAASWLAPSEWPPLISSAALTSAPPASATALDEQLREHRSVEEGEIDKISKRLEARAELSAGEQKAGKQRRRIADEFDRVLNAARDAVNAGYRPNVDDSDVLGTVVVLDPDDKTRRSKITHLRDDPIGLMHKRGQLLTDIEKEKKKPASLADARLEAARRWQALYERAEIGGARAIDPLKEPVDGGRFVEPNSEGSMAARDQLRALRGKLGIIDVTRSQRILGERLLVWVLGEKKTLSQVYELLGVDRRLVPLCRHLIGLLDKVAIELKVAMRPARGPQERPADKHDDSYDRYLRSFASFTPPDSAR